MVNDDLDRCVEEIEELVTGKQANALEGVRMENIDVLRAGIARILEEEYENAGN